LAVVILFRAGVFKAPWDYGPITNIDFELLLILFPLGQKDVFRPVTNVTNEGYVFIHEAILTRRLFGPPTTFGRVPRRSRVPHPSRREGALSVDFPPMPDLEH
jgi:hypothetical protein